jgi:hypothetical protein
VNGAAKVEQTVNSDVGLAREIPGVRQRRGA